jgi:hypothetical protein
MSLPKKLVDRRYHVEGELRYVKKQLFRELFALLLTLIKAAGDCHVVIWAPIPRWLHYSCCSDPSHCTNRNSDDFAGNMNLALADIRQWLEDMTPSGNLQMFTSSTRNRDRRRVPNPSAGRAGSPALPRLPKEIFRSQATTARTGATLPEEATHGSPPDQGAAAAAPAVRPQEASTEKAARAAVPPLGQWSAALGAAVGGEGGGGGISTSLFPHLMQSMQTSLSIVHENPWLKKNMRLSFLPVLVIHGKKFLYLCTTFDFNLVSLSHFFTHAKKNAILSWKNLSYHMM